MLEKWYQHLCGKIHSSLPCWYTYTQHFLHSAMADLQQAWPKPMMMLQRHSPRFGQHLPRALAGISMLFWFHTPSRKTSLQNLIAVVSYWKSKWEKTPNNPPNNLNKPQTPQPSNPTTSQLDGIPDTLAWQVRMFRHCYALRGVCGLETWCISPHTAEFLCQYAASEAL